MAYDYPLIVIGAGAAGLVVAIGAAKAGKRVLLIERGSYGGDCTNFGCIPSKAVIASGKIAHSIHSSAEWGIDARIAQLDTSNALERARNIVKSIRQKEEPEALANYGLNTLTGEAMFIDPHTLVVTLSDGEAKRVTADQIAICTGSKPKIPELDGLKGVPYLTNETIFDLEKVPEHLLVLGGGPIGSELAHAFRRLGAKVTIAMTQPHLLAKEEPEARSLIEKIFRNEGIALLLNCQPERISEENGQIRFKATSKLTGEEIAVDASHLLVCVGRAPELKSLNLDAAAIKYSNKGIAVDTYGRTSQRNIWAAGDISGKPPFTHMAEYDARRVLFNMLAPWPFKRKACSDMVVPRVTFCDPEVAAIGMGEEQAVVKFGSSAIACYRVELSDVDRAITEGAVEGFVKVVTKKWSSKILGATIIAPRAGEMLIEIIAAMHGKIALRKLTEMIHPYPTYSLAVRKAADLWLTETLLPRLKRIWPF